MHVMCVQYCTVVQYWMCAAAIKPCDSSLFCSVLLSDVGLCVSSVLLLDDDASVMVMAIALVVGMVQYYCTV